MLQNLIKASLYSIQTVHNTYIMSAVSLITNLTVYAAHLQLNPVMNILVSSYGTKYHLTNGALIQTLVVSVDS